MKHVINLYIVREISTLFLLGISVFTLILVMGRLVKLTEMVVSRGVPLADVALMLVYLMPTFLVFTIPMAFLLAVLLAFGRLSADNEITVMKTSGISLLQLMPPVLLCGLVASFLTLAASIVGIPWGNSAYRSLSMNALKQNVAATIREKVFWDDIPGLVMYTDHYDEQRRTLSGVVIHDGRDTKRPLTIFAASGTVSASDSQKTEFRLALNNGSIHTLGSAGEYRLVNFGDYIMTVNGDDKKEAAKGFKVQDMYLDELSWATRNQSLTPSQRLKASVELHSRFSFPCASLVFAVVGVPLGLQNRRSGKSAGFATSIGLLLVYYIIQTLLQTMAEKGALTPFLALWFPNLLFLTLGGYLLLMAARERETVFARSASYLGSWFRRS